MVGIDVTSYKTAAFALSAMFCGTIGAIYASWVAYIDPSDAFSTLLSLKVPVMTLLGGPGTVLGPVVGAWIFVVLEEMIWAQFLELNRAILGVRDRAAHLHACRAGCWACGCRRGTGARWWGCATVYRRRR